MKNLNKKKQNYNSQMGITLIALIITIIVMLILVGVTISVALNGGMFKKAEDAAKQTQIESEKEQLMMAVLGAYDVETGVDFTKIELPEIFEGEKGIYTSKETGKIYSVNPENAEITDGKKQNIECYVISYVEDDGTEVEAVYTIDYTKKVAKCYFGPKGGKLELMDDEDSTIIITDIITNYNKEFYVVENGERIDIGTGATKLIFEKWPKNNYFISKGKIYFDEVEENETNGIPVDSNFDISRLVEK